MAETFPRFGLSAVQFMTTNADEVESGIISRYEKASGRTLASGDPVRLFLLTIAAEICALRAEVNISAQNNLLSYARGEYLDALGTYFGVTRLAATAAVCTVRFTLSTTLEQPVTIPAGSQVTNGTYTFSTNEEAMIPAGGLSVDTTATCTETGTAANGLLAGQISTMVEPIPYIAEVANTDTTADGSNEEDDASLAARIRLAPNSFSVAGPSRAYEYHAYSASPSIIDVSVDSPTPGVVNVYLLAKSGAMPSSELLDQVQAYLSGDSIRPLTDEVHVLAPEAVHYSIVADYYIAAADRSTASVIRTAVTTAVEEFRQWQSLHIGRDINPNQLVKYIIAAGARKVDLSTLAPSAAKELTASQVAVCDGITLTYKGLCDE